MKTTEDFYASLRNELEEIQAAGLLKLERTIQSPQGSHISTRHSMPMAGCSRHCSAGTMP
jgi:hypothetical protein